MAVYSTYCIIACIVSIVLNAFFIVVSHLRRVEGFQEVLIFMQNISGGYMIMSFCLLATAPQSVTLGTATIRIPNGFLESFDPGFLNAVSSLGAGCYLYTVMCFCILFFYRYNVTCKTSTLSTIFSRKNILVFLIAAGVFCLIESVLLYYSSVDPAYLKERLNRTRDLREDLVGDLASMQTQMTVQGSQNVNSKNMGTHLSVEQSAGSSSGGQMSYLQTTPKIVNVFGTDYQRNPMVFLSLGIFLFSAGLSFVATVVTSLIVVCKLRGTENYGKESMSNKSKGEQQQLTRILMLAAYLPIILVLIPAVNFAVCMITQKSLLIQEYVTCMIVPIIPLSFPVFIILLVPALRVTAWQVIICKAWKTNDDNGDSDINGNTAANSSSKNLNDDGLSNAQMKALKTMAKN